MMAPPSATFQTKIKVQLKLAIARLRMIQNRDTSLSKTHRRSMARLLEQGKMDSARIRVENIIRSDIITELHELLELYCELLLARVGLLDSGPSASGHPTCDPGLEEGVKSIMFAAPKTEIKELQTVRNMLADKFGKEFALAAAENRDGKVSDKVVRKLGVEPPKKELVDGYLEEIAAAYGVDWSAGGNDDDEVDGGEEEVPNLIDDDLLMDATAAGTESGRESASMKDLMGLESLDPTLNVDASDDAPEPKSRADMSISTSSMHKLKDFPEEHEPVVVNPPSPSTENVHPRVRLNSLELKPATLPEASPSASPLTSPKPVPGPGLLKPAGGRAGGSVKANATPKKSSAAAELDSLDDLAKRFAALKKP